jgi:tRNA (adenine57-N1/adenine58-N1)-methyltransferase
MGTAGVADRVEVRTGDLTEELDALVADEKPFDVLTLDTGDAPTVVERADELLASGGCLAVYSPFVEGTREAVVAAREAGLQEIETLETIQREMDFSDRGSRPSTAGVGHTGYLVFARAP